MGLVAVVSWIIGLLCIVIVALLFLVIVRKPRHHVGSISDFQRHVAYMGRSLADGGTVDIHIPGVQGPIEIRKTVYKTKPASIILRITAGRQGRDVVVAMAEALERQHIAHIRRFTNKQKSLRDIRIAWEAENPYTPAAVTHVLKVCADAIGVSFQGQCSIVYWSIRDPKYRPREEDPASCEKPYRWGYVIGKAVGTIMRVLRG